MPNSLKTLTFGNCFNQSLQGVTLPSSLKSLRFGDAFNQSLEGKLPDGLEDLAFGRAFDRSLPEVPNSLQSLRLGVEFRFQENLEGASLPIRSLFHRDLLVSCSGMQENTRSNGPTSLILGGDGTGRTAFCIW